MGKNKLKKTTLQDWLALQFMFPRMKITLKNKPTNNIKDKK